MSNSRHHLPSLFLDDGHPEARDYDNNYAAPGDHKEPRGLLARLFALEPAPRRRSARPPQAERITADTGAA